MAKAKKTVKKASNSKKAPKTAKTKAVKKVKAVKPVAKASKKSSGTASKTAKPLKKLVKAVAKALTGKSDSKPKEKASQKPVEEAVVPKAVKTKKEKPNKKAKKKSEGFELEEDDLLAGDEDLGSEDIPDLSEFEENEEPEDDTADADDSAEWLAGAPKPDSDEVVLTDAEGRKYCRVRDCDQAASVESYCRYHYLLLWKKIQVRRKILTDGKLERYVEELTSRYPDKFLEMIRKDLRSEKDFLAAIAELEIDESASDNDFEDETQSFIDEVRGISTESSMSDDDDY